jgi:acetyl-CoA carboxylase/biotin carboxylase 1
MMEMYADKEARGGILEPPGICEVKFRVQDQIAAMHRLDSTLVDLDAQLAAVSESDVDSAETIQASIKAREESLLPFYLQVAHEFADLHDRSGRMKAKGVIRDALEWKDSRNYFFWRVNRRLNEDSIIRELQKVDDSISVDSGRCLIKDLAGDAYNDDSTFVSWKEANEEKIKSLISTKKHEGLKKSVTSLLGNLTEEEKKAILSEI